MTDTKCLIGGNVFKTENIQRCILKNSLHSNVGYIKFVQILTDIWYLYEYINYVKHMYSWNQLPVQKCVDVEHIENPSFSRAQNKSM